MTFETTYDAGTGLFDTHRVDVAQSVPCITVTGNYLLSNAVCPRAHVDTCASWSDADRKRALRLIRNGRTIECGDGTSYAAAIALNLNEITHNRKHLSLDRIVKTYATPSR